MDISLVYMVAGMSSRFGGKIKPLAKVGPNNETLIEHSLNQALPAGFTKIIFIVSKNTEKFFKEIFGENYKGVPVEYALQEFDPEKRDRPWGTCDAVCSIPEIKEPFIICTGDDIYGEKTFKILADHLKKSQEDATASKDLIEMLPEQGTVNRGIFEINDEDYVIDGTENLGISRQDFKERGFEENSPVSISIFALHPNTMQLLKEKTNAFKEQNKDDRKIECLLNVELINLIKENKIKIKLYKTSEKWIGITNPDDELKVRNELQKQN